MRERKERRYRPPPEGLRIPEEVGKGGEVGQVDVVVAVEVERAAPVSAGGRVLAGKAALSAGKVAWGLE